MLTIYLNTTENLFLDASGAGFPDKSPEFSVGGKEEIRIFLKKATSDWGTAAARPAEWPADTSWAAIPGITAMLTVDDDYKKYVQGSLLTDAESGSEYIIATIADTDSVPTQGVLRFFDNSGSAASAAFDSRSIDGKNVTFALSAPLNATYSAGTPIDCNAAPLAQAYLDASQSNWQTGELFFKLTLDSFRLRNKSDYSNSANIQITGVELLLYTVNDGINQVLKSFLIDTASLRNVQGTPGFGAPLPLPFEDQISAEVNRQIEGVADRVTPEISASGTWLIDGVDTGKPSTGLPGQPGVAAGFGAPVLNVTTGEPGTQASGTISASGPNTAKVFAIDLTIPQGRQGDQGPKGDPMKIDATGVSSELNQYDAESKGFAFLATDTGMVYIKNSDTSGDWSAPVGFQGPAGYTPVRGTDYWTESDIAEIKSYVDEAILNGAW